MAPTRLSFARGLITFAVVSAVLLWPLALFLTWWGDCLGEACPAPSAVDRAVYALDGIALIAAGVIAVVTAIRPRRRWFGMLIVIGLAFAAQAGAGLLGVRAFSAFGLVLPAAAVLVTGGYAAIRSLSADRTRWAEGTLMGGISLGLATHVVAWLVLAGAMAIAPHG